MQNLDSSPGISDSGYDEFLKNVGTYLLQLRHQKNTKMTAVAKDLGISHSIVSRIENGSYESLSFNLLKRFVSYYHMSMEDFLSPIIHKRKYGSKKVHDLSAFDPWQRQLLN
jgi:transcriptional regulator with XRE-family HTH domain